MGMLIRNEDDYTAALADVESLMKASPGSPEGGRLAQLVPRIEAYEAERWAMR